LVKDTDCGFVFGGLNNAGGGESQVELVEKKFS